MDSGICQEEDSQLVAQPPEDGTKDEADSQSQEEPGAIVLGHAPVDSHVLGEDGTELHRQRLGVLVIKVQLLSALLGSTVLIQQPLVMPAENPPHAVSPSLSCNKPTRPTHKPIACRRCCLRYFVMQHIVTASVKAANGPCTTEAVKQTLLCSKCMTIYAANACLNPIAKP